MRADDAAELGRLLADDFGPGRRERVLLRQVGRPSPSAAGQGQLPLRGNRGTCEPDVRF